MAITKILTIGEGRGYAGKYLKQAIQYILSEEKTQKGRYAGTANCQLATVYEQMKETKELFGKTDKRQGYHIIISFEEEQLSPSVVYEIAEKFVSEYLGREYETVFAVHDNTEHTHVHIIFNSVNCLTGKKYRYEKGDWAKEIQPITNRLCKEYGLATIDVELEEIDQNEHYKDWNEFRDGKFVWRDLIARDIDACILQAGNFEEFLELLRKREYEIKQNKYLAVKPKGMQRFCRCRSMGPDYTEERIRERIELETLQTYTQERNGRRTGLGEEYSTEPKLTGMQKVYYKKVSYIRNLRKLPYSKAYPYREDIRKLHEWNEKYLFLIKFEIHSLSELEQVKEHLERKKVECQNERKIIQRKKKSYASLFELADKLEELQAAEHSFLNGDDFFLQEHQQYQRLEGQMKETGYSLETAQKLKKDLKAKASGNYEKRKAVRSNLKLASQILLEYEAMVLERYEQLEHEKNKSEEREQPKR